MKILMTADTVGGVWTYARDLARSLGESGVEVVIATMGPRPSAAQREEIRSIPTAQLCESDYKLEWMHDPWADVERAGHWLLGLEEKIEPDVVHLNGYAHGSLPWKAPTVMVAHSCVLSWWLAAKAEPAPECEWAKYRENVRNGLHAAHCIIAPTRAMLNDIERLHGQLPNKRVVLNGRNSKGFHTLPQKEEFIASAGRLWDDAKNIGVLGRISSDLRWPVWIAGETTCPGGEEGFRYLGGCGLVGQLKAQEFASFLSRAAVFCLPARYEPFGLCILEAALSSCSLVLGDIPSLREIWDGAALFVAPNDESRLVEALNAVTHNRKLRTELAQFARQRASGFTAARMAAEYRAIYASLLSRVPVSDLQLTYEVRACAS